jgi:hypothetical protein
VRFPVAARRADFWCCGQFFFTRFDRADDNSKQPFRADGHSDGADDDPSCAT